jgi:hypothetical protein
MTDGPIPYHWMLKAYEPVARARYLRRFAGEFAAWLEDEGPMPDFRDPGESPEETN